MFCKATRHCEVKIEGHALDLPLAALVRNGQTLFRHPSRRLAMRQDTARRQVPGWPLIIDKARRLIVRYIPYSVRSPSLGRYYHTTT